MESNCIEVCETKWIVVALLNTKHSFFLFQGTHTEVMYKLLTYGIPVDVIPITSSGIVKTKDFGRWIQRRRTKDQNLATRERLNPSDYFSGLFMEDRIELPSNRDVLLGTGKPLMKHPGNQNFRNVVDGLLDVYDTTPSPRDKGELTWGVVRFIQNEGGRFLKREKEGDWWIVASDQEARDKTGKVFVNQRGNKKKRGPARNTAFPSLSGDVTWNSPGDIQKPRITVAPSQEIADSHVDSSSKKRQKGNPSESHPLHASDCFGWCGASSTPMSLKTFVTNQGMVPVPVQVQARGERIMDPEHQNGKNTCSW